MPTMTPQEKPFGWGAVIAAALGGFVVGDMGDSEQAPDVAAYVEQSTGNPVGTPVQGLYEPPPQYSLPAQERDTAFDMPVYYANCSAARAAGAAPVRDGDPGYASHLDRDGDGVGCE